MESDDDDLYGQDDHSAFNGVPQDGPPRGEVKMEDLLERISESYKNFIPANSKSINAKPSCINTPRYLFSHYRNHLSHAQE